MDDLGKELDRSRDEAETDGATLASDEDKAHRIASDIDRVMKRSRGGKANNRDAVDRAKLKAGR